MSRMSEYHAELSAVELTNDLDAARKHHQNMCDHLSDKENRDSWAYYSELLRAGDLLTIAKMKAGVA